MPKTTRVALLVLTLALAWPGVHHAEDDPIPAIRQMLRDGDHAEATAALRKLVAAEPDNGLAWYLLGFSYHMRDMLDEAVEADRKATEFASVRADAFYNLACALARRGDVDEARDALHSALAAGFVDFDQLQVDPDIAVLRERNLVPFPAANDYDTLKARNGVEIRYKVILPDGYDASKSYPALVSFAPGSWGPLSCDWEIDELWGDSTRKGGWIAVHLIAPDQGWMTHPSHHALEELLGGIRDRHRIEGGQFHLVGVETGARPASTYSGMSGRYFQSLTTVGNRSFERWDDDELERFGDRRVFFLVGQEDPTTLASNRRVAELMRKGGTTVDVEVVDGTGRIPTSLLDGGLTRFLDEKVRGEEG